MTAAPAWEGRAWEWLVVQLVTAPTRDFGIPTYLNVQAADGYYFMGYGTSAAIGVRKVGSGSIYFVAYRDGKDAYLDGGKTYSLNVPGPVPANLFWSNTVYDGDTRVLIATDQNRAALRSHVDQLQVNADGSYDFYFGPRLLRARKTCGSRPSRAKGSGPSCASMARKRLASTATGNPATTSSCGRRTRALFGRGQGLKSTDKERFDK